MEDEISGPPVRGEAGIAGLVPFGLESDRPRHYREALGAVWENRDRLPYAWKILSHGVCDGCSLGPRGLADDVMPGLHVCTNRLKHLRSHTIGPFAESEVADIRSLRKKTEQQLRQLGRVPYPFIYRPGTRGFRRISWAEALEHAGAVLAETKPERTAWLATSTGLTNEAYYALSKAARLLGSNNVDFGTPAVHSASATGLGRTLGYAAPTCSLHDWIGTDLLILWGTHLARHQPVSARYIAAAKAHGTRVVVVNPMHDEDQSATWIPSQAPSALFGTRLADDFVKVHPGGDLALLHAVMKQLIRWGAVDRAYIDAHTIGWDAYVESLAAQDLNALIEAAGVTRGQVDWLAQLIARAEHMVSVWSTGLTRHPFGADTVSGVAHLHLSQGAIGTPLNGLVPLHRHSGAQGGREVGIGPIDPADAAKLAEMWGHPVSDAPGLDSGAMLQAARDGGIDVLYAMGELGVEDLGDIRLRVHQDTHLTRASLLEPAEATLLLPAQTRYEQRGGGTSTNAERRIRFSPEIPGHPIVGESRPAYEIPALVACAARPELKRALLFGSSQAVRDEIGQVVPLYAGIETLKSEGDWIQWGGTALGAGGRFENLPDQRARFVPLVPPEPQETV